MALRRACAALLLTAVPAAALHAATVTTLITTPLVIEGLTNDSSGNLYAPARSTTAGQACPVYRVPLENASLSVVGLIPAPSPTTSCSPSGLAFGPDGQLYVTQTDRIYRFRPNAATPPTAELFAANVPGTNGLAFDKRGNLWTGDGTTGQGRVWRIDTAGTPQEMFRIPPMANEVNLVAGVGGVGRDVRTLGPGTITVTPTSRNAANTLGSQPLVANGIAVTRRGNILVADTARGAIWVAFLDGNGNVASNVGCDTTFAPNTLCMDNVVVAHPYLEGVDGIALDVAGGIWAVSNERQAVLWVSPYGEVIEVFRNPADATTKLRNKGPLESPASPVVVGNRFCTSNSDGNRRDNSPNTEGEIGGPGQDRGKISCISERINIPGLALPIR
jgi:sugar lactone lactonase YvrE